MQAGQSKESPSTGAAEASTSEDDAIVPTVRVRLLQSVYLPPQQSTFVRVQVESYTPEMDSVLMENDPKVEEVAGVKWKMPCSSQLGKVLLSYGF